MKIGLRIVLILVMVAVLGVAMQTLVAKKERDRTAFAEQARPPATVEVDRVVRESWQQYLLSVGTFTAVNDVSVTTEVDGKITAIHFQSGQAVNEGDVLVSLDTAVDRAELQALEAEERLMQLQFERSQRLLKEKNISKSEFDIAAARRDEAAALVRAKAASVSKKTIRAPFYGILGIRRVNLGEFLESGSEIVSLKSITPIFLDFGTPERYISSIAMGLPMEASVHAYPGEKFVGEITAIEPGVDRATRNMYIRGQFDNADLRLRPGMFAEIRGLIPEQREVLTLPETAVTYTPYGNSVFVVEEVDGVQQVSRQMIETGDVRNGRVAVTSGLEVGQTVVSAGHNKLRNGMAVQLDTAPKLSASEVH